MRKTGFPSQLILALLLLLTLQEPASAVCTCEVGCKGSPFTISTGELRFVAVRGTTSARQTFTVTINDELLKSPGFIGISYQIQGMTGPSAPFFLEPLGGVCNGKEDFFTTGLTLCVVFNPATPGDYTSKITISKIKVGPSSCGFEEKDPVKTEVNLFGRALSSSPSFTISPDSANLINDNDLFREGKPVEFTISVSGGDVQFTNAQFLNEANEDLGSDAPFEFVGFPPNKIVERGTTFRFTVRPFFPRTGGGPFFFRGKMRISAMGVGIGNPLQRDVPLTLNIIFNGIMAPTLGQWGMIILSLMLVTAGLIFTERHRPVLTETSAGDVDFQFDSKITRPLILMKPFSKVLAAMLAIAMVGIAICDRIFGQVEILDVAGTLVCTVILAYIVHFLLITVKYSRKL